MLEKSLSLPFVRFLLISVGLFVVLFGMADIASRVGGVSFGSFSNATLFGPIAAHSADTDPIFQQNTSLVASLATTGTSTTPLIPARIKIPSIGVSAVVDPVGETAAGAMATPKDFAHVGWYSLGALPGGQGSAVFAGHVNNALTKAGVFEHLSQVKIGDIVTVSNQADKTLIYVVTELGEYPASGAPAAAIFTKSGPSVLALITCDGSWDGGAHSFDKRLVVYARLRP